MARPAERTAHRASILTFRSDPGESDDAGSFDYWPDGVLVVANGKVEAVGAASDLLASRNVQDLTEHRDSLIIPGFIDTHIHFPQTDVIASGGRSLLEWLERYTFPAEARFADREHASEVAEFFLDELLANGTTTAQALGTMHAEATDAFFENAARRSLRMIAGKVLMDRHSPENLRDTVDQGERDTRELIDKWHGKDRLHYAITPRFAPTSSDEQLASAGRIAAEYPTVYVHSHLAEN